MLYVIKPDIKGLAPVSRHQVRNPAELHVRHSQPPEPSQVQATHDPTQHEAGGVRSQPCAETQEQRKHEHKGQNSLFQYRKTQPIPSGSG